MSVFGYLVMEMELRMISNARPNLPRNDKMGLTMQRSFIHIVLCMLSNFLVFAVGIGSVCLGSDSYSPIKLPM